ncbi:MAG: NAD-dependent epimerase/dehydratase family protein [Thermoguttaceae bacterium]|jgi:CDP-paratose 2-epimerase
MFQHILITGGGGFVGSSLALKFKEAFPGMRVSALDNLHRRGSELNLSRLRAAGVAFVHGDVRCPEDLDVLPEFDLLIDCAAEPSVQAGAAGSPRYVLNNNLIGTIHCLEAARLRRAAFLLLSTSRVYPIATLNALPFTEDATRFRWTGAPGTPGFSGDGVAESFPLAGPRSFYGASKLASELLLQEYAYAAGMKALINRCGILAGPWQMGKVDQGVITLWVARHCFEKPLQYVGFDGGGKQVRDLLHVDDLFDLLVLQLQSPAQWDASIYNVGGGPAISVSLLELTALCEKVTGRRIPIAPVPQTSAMDLRIYLSDSRKAQRDFGWRPTRGVEQILDDIYRWIDAHRAAVAPLFGC